MISFEEAKKRMAENAQVIDVRNRAEFKGGHIPGAKNIPVEEITVRAEKEMPLEESYILYCHSGYRSTLAMETLRLKGYQHLYNLGGISNWKGELEK